MKNGILLFICILISFNLVGCTNNKNMEESESILEISNELKENDETVEKEKDSIYVENKKLSQYKEINSDKLTIEIISDVDAEIEINCFLVGGNGWVNDENNYINDSTLSDLNNSVVLNLTENKKLEIDFSKIDESVSHIDLYSILHDLTINTYKIRLISSDENEILFEELSKEKNSLEILRIYKIENKWYLDFSNRQTDLTTSGLIELYKVY